MDDSLSAVARVALKYLKRHKLKTVTATGAVLVLLFALRKLASRGVGGVDQVISLIYSQTNSAADADKKEATAKRKPGLDRQFFQEFRFVLRIIVPGVFSAEFATLAFHTLVLVWRTFLSLYVADLDGRLVQSIVEKDFDGFLRDLAKWVLIALPATFTNSLIRYLESQLTSLFRKRLVRHCYDVYFANDVYYKVSALDSRLRNPEHLLTEDSNDFAVVVGHLYGQVTKPLLDIVLVAWRLKRMAEDHGRGHMVVWGLLFSTVVLAVSARTLRAISPQFGKLVSEKEQTRAAWHYLHSRLIQNVEEVAFYRGENAERSLLEKSYTLLESEYSALYRQRLWYVMVEQFIMKYMWTATGMLVIAVPILLGTEAHGEESVAVRTGGYTTAMNMLSGAADAAERLMSSYKEVVELTGYTSRIYELLHVLEEVRVGKWQRITANSAGDKEESNNAALDLQAQLALENDLAESTSADGEQRSLAQRRLTNFNNEMVRGKVVYTQGEIRLANVPVVTPNGDVIVRSLSFEIRQGMHLLITGPNGCGKSSLFRIISGLWPLFDGTMHTAPASRMFYVPQRPYMSIGTLRDQFIYPDTREDAIRKGITDENIESLMRLVHLHYLIMREGGLDAIRDWKDVLSGGEKQRIGIARVFYHKCMYALLDECTSAVSIDVEAHLYQTMKELGMTILTVSHRPSLWKFHTHILRFDGVGKWTFEPLTDEMIRKAAEQSLAVHE